MSLVQQNIIYSVLLHHSSNISKILHIYPFLCIQPNPSLRQASQSLSTSYLPRKKAVAPWPSPLIIKTYLKGPIISVPLSPSVFFCYYYYYFFLIFITLLYPIFITFHFILSNFNYYYYFFFTLPSRLIDLFSIRISYIISILYIFYPFYT